MKNLDKSVKNIILRDIKYHNCCRMDWYSCWFIFRKMKQMNVFFTKLIRDADKLDIYRVVTEYYDEQKKGRQNKTIELNLPNTSGVSREVCNQLMDKCIVDIKKIQNLNDFKLLQMCWIFDVNFNYSIKKIIKKNYLNIIRKFLPENKLIDKDFNVSTKYLG